MTRSQPLGVGRTDDRAVSIAVNHVLAVGITTVLIVGLLTAGGDVLSDRSDTTTKEGLRIVGNKLASEIEAVSRLAENGGSVTVTQQFPASVAGKSYSVELRTDSTCPSGVPACVVLEADGKQVVVGVNNETPVSLDSLGAGKMRITATAPSSATGFGSANATSYSDGVYGSIGAGSGQGTPVGGTSVINQQPVARFDINPENVKVGDVVVFDASESTDPDGSIDTYRWDFDGDCSDPSKGLECFERNTTDPTAAYQYETPGQVNVTLRVVDNDGATGNTSNTFKIAGLVLTGSSTDPDGDSVHSDVALNFENKHSSTANIQAALFDPDNITIKRLKNTDGGAEIFFVNEGLDDGDSDGFPIDSGGLLREWPSADIDIGGGSSETIELNEFVDIENESIDMRTQELTVGLRYTVDGTYYTTKYTLTPGGPNGARNNGDENQNINECTPVQLKVDYSGTAYVYDWSVIGNPHDLSLTWTKIDGKKAKIYVQGVPNGETQEIYVEAKVYDYNGNSETIRWKLEVDDSGGCSSQSAYPNAEVKTPQSNPKTGTSVTFNASESFDTDGTITTYEWDFDGDGTTDQTTTTPTTNYIYTSAGDYTVRVTVTDSSGNSVKGATSVEVSPSEVYVLETFDDGQSIADDPLWDRINDPNNKAKNELDAVNARSGSYSLHIGKVDDYGGVYTKSIDTSAVPSVNISVAVQQSGNSEDEPDGGEDLLLQYRDKYGNWDTIKRFEATGTNGDYNVYTFTLSDSDALHEDFAIRLVQESADAEDVWHVDDICIAAGRSCSGGGSNSPPSASLSYSPSSPSTGETVTFDASASTDVDGSITQYKWDLDNDGNYDDATGATVTKQFSSTGSHDVSVKVIDNDGATDTATVTVSVASWSPVKISDDFEDGNSISSNPNWSVTNGNGNVDIEDNAADANSPTHSVRIGEVDDYGGVQSKTLDTSGAPSVNISVTIKQGDSDSGYSGDPPDAGESEDLVIQYRDSTGSWVTIKTYQATNSEDPYVTFTTTLTASQALHSNFAVRVVQVRADYPDIWHVDDICVAAGETCSSGGGSGSGSAPAIFDEFEDGDTLSANGNWSVTAGDSGDVYVEDESSIASSPSHAVHIGHVGGDGGGLESKTVDTSSASSVNVSIAIKEGGNSEDPPESDEDLKLQYRDPSGNWDTFRTIDAQGSEQSYIVVSARLTVSEALHSNFAIRVVQDSTSWTDSWHVDDICVAMSRGCPDIGNEPTIDTFDVTDNNHPNHAQYDIAWSVSDPDSNLDTVTIELVDDSGTVVDSTTIGVSGGSASGTDSLQENFGQGNSYKIRITVTDTDGNTVSKVIEDTANGISRIEGEDFHLVSGGTFSTFDADTQKVDSFTTPTNVAALGPGTIDLTGDGRIDIPYVTDNGKLKLTNETDKTVVLASDSDIPGSGQIARSKTSLAVGTWNGSAPSVFFVDKNHDKIYRVTADGSVTEVADPSNGAQAVVGMGDIDDDNAKELIFADGSQQLRYVDDGGGINKVNNGGVGSNNGIGAGAVADFDGDGVVSVVVVDSSNNIKITGEPIASGGEGTTVINSADAKKSPVSVADVDGDGSDEIVYLSTNGDIKYVDDVGGSNTIKTLTDANGNTISGSDETGVSSLEATGDIGRDRQNRQPRPTGNGFEPTVELNSRGQQWTRDAAMWVMEYQIIVSDRFDQALRQEQSSTTMWRRNRPVLFDHRTSPSRWDLICYQTIRRTTA